MWSFYASEALELARQRSDEARRTRLAASARAGTAARPTHRLARLTGELRSRFRRLGGEPEVLVHRNPA